jgi:hypothetical protein
MTRLQIHSFILELGVSQTVTIVLKATVTDESRDITTKQTTWSEIVNINFFVMYRNSKLAILQEDDD